MQISGNLVGPRTATVKALIHRIRTAVATQPPGRPWPGIQAPAPAQFSCLPIFAKRLASYGLARVWAKARQPNPPDDGPRSHGFQVPMIISVLSISCFDRSWDIVELSRAGEQGNGYNQTNTNYPPGYCGHWIPAHCPRCWVTLSPGHHCTMGHFSATVVSMAIGGFVQTQPTFPTFIRQEILMRTRTQGPSATETEVKVTSLFLFTLMLSCFKSKRFIHSFRLSLLQSRKYFTKVSTLNFEIHERT